MSGFTHLHVHTQYSLNDSAAKIDTLAKKAKELGMTSIAITDHGNMFGVIDFYKAVRGEKLKPIIGCEIYVCPAGKEVKVRDNRHIVLLAKNNIGYSNLVKLASEAALDGFYYNPRVDYETLYKYREGLICLTACLGGDVAKEITVNGYTAGMKRLQTYIDIFGKDNVYLEIQDNGLEDQYQMNDILIRMSKEMGVSLVATNDVHYIDRSDAKNHDVLMAMQAGTTIYDKNRKIYGSDEFYLKSPEEMYNSRLPREAIENTMLIAEQCNVEIEFGHYHIPKFTQPPTFKTAADYLRHLSYHGLRARYPDYEERKQELHDRLDYELGVVERMGYVDYFLITQDYVNYAISLGAIPSPGRGSGAGSILAYVLNITNVEPLRYGLIFERFLNPDRVSMPDIDWDIQDDLRAEIIKYLVNKYGRKRVAQIITFGTYAARLAVRAVGRALNVPYQVADEVAKAIPAEIGITIKQAIEKNPELAKWYAHDPQRKELLDVAMAIEGLPSHTGTHAAGVLITPDNTTEHVPVWSNDGVVVAQFDMVTLEELGLLKADLLGLKTLTVISNTIKGVKKNHGITITNQDLLNMIDDPTSYILIAKGLTQGVFQMEGDGMTAVARDLQPQNIDEVTALISLYRPGPMQYIPQYIANKRNPDGIKLRFESLREIFTDTYGILVYQEQVMFAAQILAGYPMAASDELRSAISKKKKQLIDDHRGYLIDGRKAEGKRVAIPGAISRGYNRRDLEEFYNEVEEFGKYCFNKSHGASYAYLAAQTSHLKYHYPSEFMAALMTSVSGNKTKIAKYMKHCKTDLNIQVLPPSINESGPIFEASPDGNIRFALGAVRDVGVNAVIEIVAERRVGGRFKNFSDFVYRCVGTGVSTKATEALIRCGAFDEFGRKRSELLSMLFDICLDFKNLKKKLKESTQSFLFDPVIHTSDNLPSLNEIPMKTLLKVEREFTGFYLSGHPLDAVRHHIERLSNVSSLEFAREVDEQGIVIQDYEVRQGQKVKFIGILTRINVISTKKNDLMAFADIDDQDGKIDLVIFPSTYASTKDLLVDDNIVLVSGYVSIKDENNPQVVVDTIEKIDHKFMQRIYVRLSGSNDELLEIKRIAANPNCRGDMPVYLVIGSKQMLLTENYWLNTRGYESLYHHGIRCVMKEE